VVRRAAAERTREVTPGRKEESPEDRGPREEEMTGRRVGRAAGAGQLRPQQRDAERRSLMAKPAPEQRSRRQPQSGREETVPTLA